MQALIQIIALIAIIIFVYYAVTYVWDYYNTYTQEQIKAEIRPPLTYMNTTGIKCPDYFTYTGNDANGNYMCENTFNVPINSTNSSKCLNMNSNKAVVFAALESGKDWSTMTDYEKQQFLNDKKTTDTDAKTRCEWVNQCGGVTGNKAVWLGVQNICEQNYTS